MVSSICEYSPKSCANFIFTIAGFDEKQLQTSKVNQVAHALLAGTSVRTLLHYFQLVNSGKFENYDFGRRKNMAVYGRKTPPDYSLESVTAPCALYSGKNDFLAHTKASIYSTLL